MLFGLLDHVADHVGDFAHERSAGKFAVLDLGEFVFPLAGELGRAQFRDFQAA